MEKRQQHKRLTQFKNINNLQLKKIILTNKPKKNQKTNITQIQKQTNYIRKQKNILEGKLPPPPPTFN